MIAWLEQPSAGIQKISRLGKPKTAAKKSGQTSACLAPKRRITPHATNARPPQQHDVVDLRFDDGAGLGPLWDDAP